MERKIQKREKQRKKGRKKGGGAIDVFSKVFSDATQSSSCRDII